MGAVPGPLDAFPTMRGAKTLALRMREHAKNAGEIARFLAGRSDVAKVYYPGLESHPQHALAKRQMRVFGGMVSVVPAGPVERAMAFARSLRLFSLAESLGGVESLINHPARMTHGSIPKEERERRGITDSLLRLSVGIEDVEDLIADLRQALDTTAELGRRKRSVVPSASTSDRWPILIFHSCIFEHTDPETVLGSATSQTTGLLCV